VSLAKGSCSTRIFVNTAYQIHSIQSEVQEPETFASDVVSLEVGKYESLIRKMRLPFQGLEASTAVGPFFWWSLDTESTHPQLRKDIPFSSLHLFISRMSLHLFRPYQSVEDVDERA
jgi:hypothetical protein